MLHYNCLIKQNACTLVPTVFLRHGKTEFELALSFFVYPRHQQNGIRDSIFVFCFPFSYYIENGIPTCIFVFRFPITLENRIAIVRFLISRFRKTLKTEFELRFSFFVAVFVTFVFYNNRKDVGISCLYKKTQTNLIQHVKSWQYFS